MLCTVLPRPISSARIQFCLKMKRKGLFDHWQYTCKASEHFFGVMIENIISVHDENDGRPHTSSKDSPLHDPMQCKPCINAEVVESDYTKVNIAPSGDKGRILSRF